MLPKHFALLTERVEIAGAGQLLDRLDRGRLRAREAAGRDVIEPAAEDRAGTLPH
jgi:hypothetical protein